MKFFFLMKSLATNIEWGWILCNLQPLRLQEWVPDGSGLSQASHAGPSKAKGTLFDALLIFFLSALEN